MKPAMKLFSFCLLLSFFLMVCSCSGKTLNVNLEGSMKITVYKTSMDVETTFVDSEDALWKNGKAKAYITLSDANNVEKDRKNVTINTATLIGNSITFSQLEANTAYTLKLIASMDGKQKTLQTQTKTTVANGETADDPIEIHTIEDLEAMNKASSAYYKLMADLDGNNEQLSSIFGSASNPFKGHLDGNGKTIRNVLLDDGYTYAGIFGYMDGATVANLTIENVTYSVDSRGETYLGVLSWCAKKSTIENITITGVRFTFSGYSNRSAKIGSAVGYASDSVLKNVRVSDLVMQIGKSQNSYIGGFVGHNESSEISDCSVEGSMKADILYTNNTGSGYYGGFVGWNDSTKGIQNSYAQVDMDVSDQSEDNLDKDGNPLYTGYEKYILNIGGFVGANSNIDMKLIGCAAIGKINVTVGYAYTVYIGGFAGNIKGHSYLKNCVYVPSETGLQIQLMEQKPVSDEKEETVLPQKASISLGIGNISDKAVLDHVFAYFDRFGYQPQSNADLNQITVQSTVIDQDLTNFSEIIQTVIKTIE